MTYWRDWSECKDCGCIVVWSDEPYWYVRGLDKVVCGMCAESYRPGVLAWINETLAAKALVQAEREVLQARLARYA